MIYKLLDAEIVKILASFGKVGIVRLPVCDRIFAVGACGIEYRFPKFFDRTVARELREHLLCPLFARYGGNYPLISVFHLIAVWLYKGISCLSRLCHLLLIHPSKSVRIVGLKVYHCRQCLNTVFKAFELPFFNGRERFERTIAVIDLFERLIAPLHNDLLRTRAVAFLRHHTHKFRNLDRGMDHHFLTLLHVRACYGNELCILFHYGFFHKQLPFTAFCAE